jgi:hypothetical protein
MVSAEVTNFVRRDREQQLPELVSGRDIEQSFGRATKEGTKHGLDDVVGVDTYRQLGRHCLPGKTTDTFRITQIKLSGCVVLAAAKAPH